MAHQGIKLLTSWTTAVMELVRSEALDIQPCACVHVFTLLLSCIGIPQALV
jgi:hypothetical protein